MRGRKPKPIAAQIAAGDPRKRGVHVLQKLQQSQLKVAKGLPVCPRHLSGRARAAWNMWAVELAAMDLDKRPDAQMLEGACVGYQQAVQADEIVKKEGLMVEDRALKDGVVIVLRRKAHPAIAVSRAAWSQVRSFCSEFGLSPVSRQRLAAEKPENEAEDLFSLLSQPRQPRVA